jgi:hypothetical protein
MPMNNSQLLQNSLPFKGRARVGMGLKYRKSGLSIRPIPLPSAPLKGAGHPAAMLPEISAEVTYVF